MTLRWMLVFFLSVLAVSQQSSNVKKTKPKAQWAKFKIPLDAIKEYDELIVGPESTVTWHDGADITILARTRVDIAPVDQRAVSTRRPVNEKAIHYALRKRSILLGAHGFLGDVGRADQPSLGGAARPSRCRWTDLPWVDTHPRRTR